MSKQYFPYIIINKNKTICPKLGQNIEQQIWKKSEVLNSLYWFKPKSYSFLNECYLCTLLNISMSLEEISCC